MKTSFLFPHSFKKWGWIIFTGSLILGILTSYFNIDLPFSFDPRNYSIFIADDFVDSNITDEVAGIGIIVGLCFIGFSKVKIEDEYIQKLRLDSLLWATYVNYALIVLSLIFIYGGDYLSVMIYNLFTTLIFFVIRFHIYLVRR